MTILRLWQRYLPSIAANGAPFAAAVAFSLTHAAAYGVTR